MQEVTYRLLISAGIFLSKDGMVSGYSKMAYQWMYDTEHIHIHSCIARRLTEIAMDICTTYISIGKTYEVTPSDVANSPCGSKFSKNFQQHLC